MPRILRPARPALSCLPYSPHFVRLVYSALPFCLALRADLPCFVGWRFLSSRVLRPARFIFAFLVRRIACSCVFPTSSAGRGLFVSAALPLRRVPLSGLRLSSCCPLSLRGPLWAASRVVRRVPCLSRSPFVVAPLEPGRCAHISLSCPASPLRRVGRLCLRVALAFRCRRLLLPGILRPARPPPPSSRSAFSAYVPARGPRLGRLLCLSCIEPCGARAGRG